ncbi:substrate-binding domain-containing protein [uncultured Thiothrix sp.]|uniref:LacI family DNA-binding transcriptional regulator n=1 Tax=uncultured Thiothrix sp. TaxID=223185 RepID=UPI002623950B|nr:substrate-binding domain-containing protein [uncultured Thiothrix sp.]HMT93918.1 substrate-binding domain-containing protein [Thiolinea sp.]
MSLKELSQRLGLSQTTVSRALNGYPEVSERTRQRVIQLAREMNYRPNPSAKSLATGRTEHIGIVLPIEKNLFVEPLFGEYLAGVAQFLAEADMDITVIPTPLSQELEVYEQLAMSGRVDGLLISSPAVNDARVASLVGSNLPFVVHGRTHCDQTYSYCDIDNQGAFARATRLLIELGHQHIGLINGDQSLNYANDRYLGYKSTLEQYSITYDPSLCVQGEITEESGFNAAAQLLMHRPRPSALLISNMIFALGAMRALRQHGLEPGYDVAIIVHDDYLPYLRADKFDPPLTTTSSPIRKAGYEITKMLHHEIEVDDTAHAKQQQLLEVELIIRGSTRIRRN